VPQDLLKKTLIGYPNKGEKNMRGGQLNSTDWHPSICTFRKGKSPDWKKVYRTSFGNPALPTIAMVRRKNSVHWRGKNLKEE